MTKKINRAVNLILFSSFLSLIVMTSAFAEGGLEKVNTFIDHVHDALHGASIVVVTIAIMWSGYKFLFTRADYTECGKILGGGLLIGGATELANYLLA